MKVLISIKATDIQQIEYTIWRIVSEWKIDKKEIVVYLQNEQTTSTINKAIDPNTKEKLKSSNSILKKLTKYTVGFVINQNERIKRDSIIIKK